jgi:hypothetical protein
MDRDRLTESICEKGSEMILLNARNRGESQFVRHCQGSEACAKQKRSRNLALSRRLCRSVRHGARVIEGFQME